MLFSELKKTGEISLFSVSKTTNGSRGCRLLIVK
jgi:hypothetical protein